jgi:hypothetical protein
MTDPPGDATPASAPLGDLVAAKLRRIEIAMLARVLATTLAGALPSSRVRAERRRTLADIARRRPGTVVGVTVTGGSRVLTLRVLDVDQVHARVAHEVRGITLSRQTVSLAQWLDELAGVLNEEAANDEATRQALHRALLP